MCKHEEKSCPRCNKGFECKVGHIGQCQCSGIDMSETEKNHIASKYDDCLCLDCLMELKNSYTLFTERMFFRK